MSEIIIDFFKIGFKIRVEILMKKKLFLFAVCAVIYSFFPVDSIAKSFCACCAERGHYSIRTRKPDQYIFDELKKIKFNEAKLYTDAGYPDTIKGINPLGDKFTADGNLSGNLWKFIFRDDRAKSGELNLAKPISMIEYMVDQNPLAEENAESVNLYTEWRFKYAVKKASGIFQAGLSPKTEYFLVLQGNGNRCTSAENFRSWRLEISGAKADYAFFGKISD